MPGVVFQFREGWLLDYLAYGIRADGLVMVEKRQSIVNGLVSYCVMVAADEPQRGTKIKRWKEWLIVKKKDSKYCLVAATRFEKGDVIATKRDEEEESHSDTENDGGERADPTNDNIGMGLDWATNIILNGSKKVSKKYNAVMGMDGYLLRATSRIFPGTEIVVGQRGSIPEGKVEISRDVRWLDALLYDGKKGYGKSCIGQVWKFDKTTEQYLVRFDDGRICSMDETEVEKKLLVTGVEDTAKKADSSRRKRTIDQS